MDRVLSAVDVTRKPHLQKCQEKRTESIRVQFLSFVVFKLVPQVNLKLSVTQNSNEIDQVYLQLSFAQTKF